MYPSDPLKMRVLANIVRAMAAKRVLEIGCGLGYSALWLAEAAGPGGSVETVDRFPEHAELAEGFAKEAALVSRVKVLTGDSDAVLSGLRGPYDFVHDDGLVRSQAPALPAGSGASPGGWRPRDVQLVPACTVDGGGAEHGLE